MSTQKNKDPEKTKVIRIERELLARVTEACTRCNPPTLPRLVIEQAITEYIDALEQRLPAARQPLRTAAEAGPAYAAKSPPREKKSKKNNPDTRRKPRKTRAK